MANFDKRQQFLELFSLFYSDFQTSTWLAFQNFLLFLPCTFLVFMASMLSRTEPVRRYFSYELEKLSKIDNLMFGFQKIDFFYIFRKYNILRVYCKNSRPKYELFTKLEHIVESAPRLINWIELINYQL